jgi:hypothetical protein
LSAEDFIRGLDLPVAIVGCELVPAPDDMFDIRSHGVLAGTHGSTSTLRLFASWASLA